MLSEQTNKLTKQMQTFNHVHNVIIDQLSFFNKSTIQRMVIIFPLNPIIIRNSKLSLVTIKYLIKSISIIKTQCYETFIF